MNSRRQFIKTAAAAAVAALAPAAVTQAASSNFGQVQKRPFMGRSWVVTMKSEERPPNPFVVSTDFGHNTTFYYAEHKLGLLVQAITAVHLFDDEYHLTLEAVCHEEPRAAVYDRELSAVEIQKQYNEQLSREYLVPFRVGTPKPKVDVNMELTKIAAILSKIGDLLTEKREDIFTLKPFPVPQTLRGVIDPTVGEPVVLADPTTGELVRPPLRVIGIDRDPVSMLTRVQLSGVATVKYTVDNEAAYWADLPAGKHTLKHFRLSVDQPGYMHWDCQTVDNQPIGMRSYGLPPVWVRGPQGPIGPVGPVGPPGPSGPPSDEAKQLLAEKYGMDIKDLPFPVRYEKLGA